MKKVSIFLIGIALIFAYSNLWTLPKMKEHNTTQRVAKGVYDYQRNTLSNFDFITSNFGIMGLDAEQNTGSGVWPRGTLNQYLYASGFWFGALRQKPDNSGMKKYVEISYNPNNGRSWFVPGRIEDGDSIYPDLQSKYRLYFSTDFEKYTGIPFTTSDGPNWPLWVDDTLKRYQYGTYHNIYVGDETQRNRTSYPMGPLFVSEEDILSTFKDTDLGHYDGGKALRISEGYPLKLQVQSNIYSWENEEMKDIVVQSFLLENKSNDTLRECWFAGVYDVDIAYGPQAMIGAANDRVKFFNDDSTLNLAVGWSETDKGELGKGFGYIGVSLLETPAVNSLGFIRNDKYIFEPQEQIGLTTFKNWNIAEDIIGDDATYDFISSGFREGDDGPGDKRMLISTGPFNMLPGDVARVAFSITFALPAKGGEADGTFEDITGFKKIAGKNGHSQIQSNNNSLVGKLLTNKQKYYQQQLTPVLENKNLRHSSINLVYPNPVNQISIINYQIANAGYSKLAIYNQIGEELQILKEGWFEAGTYNCELKIKNNELPSGVYYLRLQTDDGIQCKQIVIVH
jgi:hypothetical protein